MKTPAHSPYAGHRFPAEIIAHVVWLYYRFPLSLRMVEEMLAARGILISHETLRQWARKFGQAFANQIRRRLPRAGDKWHLDEVVITIAGKKHWLWRAVDQDGIVLDVLVQPARPASRQAPAAQAAQEAGPTTSGADHQQAGVLSRGPEGADARGRAPPAQRHLNNRAENLVWGD